MITKCTRPFNMDYWERGYLTGYLTHGNIKREARGKSIHKNNSKRKVRNMEERNVGRKGKSPEQGITSAKALTVELPEGCEYPYHRLD